MKGRTLGNYRLEELLGKGGMGEVYLATDTRLERKVAVKILPPEMAQDDARRQRLEREARAISGLNHPHICTLHDVGHEDGTDFLVMELLEGETLADRIGRGPMKGEEFLETALQITDALNTAHRAGLVHRDLKPGNVMLTKGGAKLLDFGLARVAQQGEISGLTAAPTMTSPLTTAGTLVGTFHYLAPELLEGGQADARSDLFALGIVLYEMVTGRRAFEAKTQAGLIGAILERDPEPVSQVVPDVVPALANLIDACLSKDPEQRIQTAHDVLLQLRWVRDGGSAVGIPAVHARGRKRMARLAWALAILFGLATLVLAAVLISREEPVPPRVMATILPSSDVSVVARGSVAISPHGALLVFRGSDPDANLSLYLHRLDRNETTKLEGAGDGALPFWAPDGKSVGVFQPGGRLSRVDLAGGGRRTLAQVDRFRGASWGSAGVIVVGGAGPGGELVQLPATGGEPVPIARGSDVPEDLEYLWPEFLPDGKHVVVLAATSNEERMQLRVVSLDGRVDRLLMQGGSRPRYAQGHLLYAQEGRLIARPFDPESFELGEPFQVGSDVTHFGDWSDFSASRNGLLALTERGSRLAAKLAVYDRDGRVKATVTLPTWATDLNLSPDGKRLALARPVSAEAQSGQDVWTYDLARDVFTRVSFDDESDDPAWTPDGRSIVYAHDGKLERKAASGVGEAVSLVDRHADAVTHGVSHDGKYVIYCVTDGGNEDLWAFDLAGDRGAFPILSSPFREYQGQLSPDGKWLAYVSDESGERQVYALRWPELDEKVQISRDGAVMPRWKGDGRELFYLSPARKLIGVPVRENGSTLDVGAPIELFATQMGLGSRTHEYDVDPSGSAFYMIEDDESGEGRPIRIITSWRSGR
jgi:Tol biopolymer transport system component/predicted Ser/Thr protein kinase